MAATSSRARAFFNAIMEAADDAARAAHIRAFVRSNPPTFETEYREFKTEDRNPYELPRQWSEAIGGFANTEGGVLVWGIDARQVDETKIDAAVAVVPISNVAAFTSRLKQLLPDATDPHLPGVEIVPIADPSAGPGQGFVVCFIPEGDYKPYRCEQKTGKPYVQRVDDDFLIINRSFLASLFHPRPKPRFKVFAEFATSTYPNNPDVLVLFESLFFVMNAGNASAKDVLLLVGIDLPQDKLSTVESADGWQRIKTSGDFAFYDTAPLHPKMGSAACEIKFLVPKSDGPMAFTPVSINLQIFAENVEPVSFRIQPESIMLSQKIEAEQIPNPLAE